MKKIKVFNKISNEGLELLRGYEIIEEGAPKELSDEAQAFLLRSYDLHHTEFSNELLAVGRAGAGVNNIPVEALSAQGIVVFNSPGANANAVKELVICALMMSNRKIFEGISWVQSLSQEEGIDNLVEKGKKEFIGPEIANKTLGVIGLGAIGILIANAAHHLEMNVLGYDPFISVESAWRLSRSVDRADSVEDIYRNADYITVHVPSNENTRGFINAKSIAKMKDGVRILNFARGDLVNDEDIKEALLSGKVAKYITDFPSKDLIGVKNVICIPHLGASTPESEINCAIMVSKEIRDYLENGNIRNSVNMPNCDMGICQALSRLCLLHKNIPNMVGQITAILANDHINIRDMMNKSKGEYAYTMLDLDSEVSSTVMEELKSIGGIIKVRKVK